MKSNTHLQGGIYVRWRDHESGLCKRNRYQGIFLLSLLSSNPDFLLPLQERYLLRQTDLPVLLHTFIFVALYFIFSFAIVILL